MLVASQNNDQMLAFAPRDLAAERSVAVRLSGPAGNPTAVGARVTLLDNSRVISASEVTAGSGFQSQSTATLFITVSRELKRPQLKIRWPDRRETIEPVPPGPRIDLASPK